LKILVTGGTGFAGSHIVDLLGKKFPSTDIAMLVRDKKKAEKREVNIFEGDLTDPDSINNSFKSFKPDIIVHSAALADDWAPLARLMEVNAQGTQNIIDAMSNTHFLVYISSSGVYPRIATPITEDCSYNPFGNYHRSKVAAEKIVRSSIENEIISGTIIRPPNIMGIRDFTHMAKICHAIKNGKFPLIANGKARQTWVAAEDLARAVLLVINQQGETNGQIYNIKSFEITVKELYDMIAVKLNISKPPKNYSYLLAYSMGIISEIIGKLRRKPTRFNRYRIIKFSKDRLFDDSKIRTELGYHPKASPEITINQTVDWLLMKGVI
jgi:nucleoside-diphosphate-sugar epimerase